MHPMYDRLLACAPTNTEKKNNANAIANADASFVSLCHAKLENIQARLWSPRGCAFEAAAANGLAATSKPVCIQATQPSRKHDAKATVAFKEPASAQNEGAHARHASSTA